MKKILVIDDDRDILEAITIILEKEGYLIYPYHSLISVKKVEELAPDLVLLDLLLKGQTGDELCFDMKKHRATKNIPIVFLSAHPYSKILNTAKSCGAIGFIQKPFDIRTLLKAVDKHILK